MALHALCACILLPHVHAQRVKCLGLSSFVVVHTKITRNLDVGIMASGKCCWQTVRKKGPSSIIVGYVSSMPCYLTDPFLSCLIHPSAFLRLGRSSKGVVLILSRNIFVFMVTSFATSVAQCRQISSSWRTCEG